MMCFHLGDENVKWQINDEVMPFLPSQELFSTILELFFHTFEFPNQINILFISNFASYFKVVINLHKLKKKNKKIPNSGDQLCEMKDPK